MNERFSSTAFARAYLLPLLWLFAVPVFAAWFFGHAADRYDAPSLAKLASLERAGKVDARAAAFWRRNPPSAICASSDPRLAKLRSRLSCGSYAQFRWGQRVAFGALGLGLFGVLLIGLLVAISLRSQRAQYLSFRVGWVALKLISLLQVLAQSALLVGLSYWVTAIWFQVFVPKLILVVALLALGAAGLMIKTIFARVPKEPGRLDGRLIGETRAPELWARVRELCQNLDTAPPDQIVVGVDANFFVTEQPLVLADKRLTGRTLYLSLPLLRVLERGEADSVLAHEMAHFSGDDTLYALKLAPLLDRYVHYLQALHAGGISLPVFYFMLAYWSLFQLSLGRESRRRELRADELARDQTSAEAMTRALVKIAAYCAYRAQVEQEVLSEDSIDADLGVAAKLARGFVGFARSPELSQLFAADPSNFGHPFDSHPPLSARLGALGSEVAAEAYSQIVLDEVEASWFDAIDEAGPLQDELWQAYEQLLGEAQQAMLAYRLHPRSDAEREAVEKSFPKQVFTAQGGDVRYTLDYAGVRAADVSIDVAFSEVASAAVEEKTFKRYLNLQLHDGRVEPICLSSFDEAKGEPFLAEVDRYLGRHFAVEAHLARQPEPRGR